MCTLINDVYFCAGVPSSGTEVRAIRNRIRESKGLWICLFGFSVMIVSRYYKRNVDNWVKYEFIVRYLDKETYFLLKAFIIFYLLVLVWLWMNMKLEKDLVEGNETLDECRSRWLFLCENISAKFKKFELISNFMDVDTSIMVSWRNREDSLHDAEYCTQRMSHFPRNTVSLGNMLHLMYITKVFYSMIIGYRLLKCRMRKRININVIFKVSKKIWIQLLEGIEGMALYVLG